MGPCATVPQAEDENAFQNAKIAGCDLAVRPTAPSTQPSKTYAKMKCALK
jgi:hypothetical protein